MQKFSEKKRKSLLLAYVGLIAAVSIFFAPGLFRSGAAELDKSGKGLIVQTESHDPAFRNFDIRTDKSADSVENLARFRDSGGTSAALIADRRDAMVRAEDDLRSRVPGVKIEYSPVLKVPEIISPDVWKAEIDQLTGPSSRDRAEILRSFVKSVDGLVGVNAPQADDLEVAADYMNPAGNLGFAHLEQRINGVPVFNGEIKAGFDKSGRMVRVVNNLAPGLDYSSVAEDFGDPLDAVKAAARHIDYKLQSPDVSLNETASDGLKAVFGEGDWATTAEKMYFPVDIGVARPAWRVLIWLPVNAYYVVVDAETGTMLWRKNITEDQTQSATYEVYRNSSAFIDVADSPAPLTPGPNDPGLGTQGALLTRENVALIGNEGPLSFNNNGWITDGNNTTDGNAVEAGVDIVAPNGVDSPVSGTNRVFSSAWNPPPGNPGPGDDPTVQAARDGAVIQMFYVTNRYHDALYQLGFTEAARNFQHDNFGRGGAGNDRVSAEGQDSSGTSNANFSTPSDGGRGRMQMYRFTSPNPDRDGTTDADVIIHELTHGTSNRLHGNGGGLGSDMSRGMGEGWSDFYAHSLLSEPTDPINGVYTTGGYLLTSPTYFANYYYGIRSQPKAVMSFTGGPGNRPHNSLTFADIDSNTASNSDGAFPARFGPNFASPHFRGEVWSSALWEVRALMIARLGATEGNRRALQIVTDGMKLAPLNPTFLQERDAIIAAASAASASPENSADVVDVWEGFRIRGMGFSASVESTSPVRVTEAFDLPNAVIANPGFAVSDSNGDNDGYPEPGEPLTVSVPLVNNTGQTITGVTVNLNGGAGTAYGDIADGATVSNDLPFTVPPGTGCGSVVTLTININGSAGPRVETRKIIIGVADAPETENFDGVTAPSLPAGWSTAQTGAGVAFVTQTGTADSAPNSVFTPNTGNPGGNAGATIDSKAYAIAAEAGVVRFRNRYDTESGWDGGVLEISIGGGQFVDIITAGGEFLEGGYNGALGANQNPLDGRPAWTGNSGGYITSAALLPASAAGQNVNFRWRFGEDDNTFSVGWNVDSVEVTKGYSCDFTASSASAPFDYDGDGKTDVSIFRPAPGEWWYLRSSDSSVFAAQFGQSTDTITPADFTGDGKSDIAFFRESTGEWYVLRSEDLTFYAFPFGTAGDIPAPGDFDADGTADAAVYRPSAGQWFILRSSDSGVSAVPFGIPEDRPVIGDYDGDGTDDIGVFRPSVSQWWLLQSSAGVIGYQFGSAGDRPVPADYTGDGKTDIGFFRPTTGEWFVLRSDDLSFYGFPFGTNGDIPVTGDYDGDGTADPGVFRPSDMTWYLLQSTNGFSAVPFGANTDVPTPSAYTP